MHLKQVPLQLEDELGHLVTPLKGHHANLVAREHTHDLQREGPRPEVGPLVLGVVQVNPLRGWQDGGLCPKTLVCKGWPQSVNSLS